MANASAHEQTTYKHRIMLSH